MQTDDRYRARLQTAIAALRYWSPSIKDAAHVVETDEGEYWRMAIEPLIAGACPFELVLRADGFHDLMIAGESYEDEPTEDLEMFVPLAEAIAGGHVRRRLYASAATGLPVAVGTVVDLADGRSFVRRRDLASPRDTTAPRASGEDIITERHFLPYHR